MSNYATKKELDHATGINTLDNNVVKNTKFNALKIKENSLKKKIPDATTLIQINQ